MSNLDYDKEELKVEFKNLSLILKVAVVTSYVTLGIYGLAFLIGFIQGMMEI